MSTPGAPHRTPGTAAPAPGSTSSQSGAGTGGDETQIPGPPVGFGNSTPSQQGKKSGGSGLFFFAKSGFNRGAKKKAAMPGTLRQVRGAQFPPKGDPTFHGDTSTRSRSSSDAATSSPKAISSKNASHFAYRPRASTEQKQAAGNGDTGSGHTGAASGVVGGTPVVQAPTKEELRQQRLDKFKKIVAGTVDLDELRKLSWFGIPSEVRAPVWKLLFGHMPCVPDRRPQALGRKRKEYLDAIPQFFDIDERSRSEDENKLLHQIEIDVPRTRPEMKFFQHPRVQLSLTRILYIWTIRHPASGYVQGINDLVTPLLRVFLQDVVGTERHLDDVDLQEDIAEEDWMNQEADIYYCLSKLLDGIQDHYTFAQPGIQRMVFRLKGLIKRIDSQLADHFEEIGLQFIQFSFRWFNCFLLRELSIANIARMWDTYLCEDNGFSQFHLYVCAALLMEFEKSIKQMEFQEMVTFLQDLPTSQWTETEVELLLSQAHIYKSLYDDAPKHLQR